MTDLKKFVAELKRDCPDGKECPECYLNRIAAAEMLEGVSEMCDKWIRDCRETRGVDTGRIHRANASETLIRELNLAAAEAMENSTESSS